MTIQIDQTLHGYQHGHQLLMSSSQLSSEAKKTLLVQSDLSGSNVVDEFKEYISGYPLATHYAFSKTWYADEMRRPGCVWTHTLLIPFADLGKIPDLDQLLCYFKRPQKDQYDSYSQAINIDRNDLKNTGITFDDHQLASILLDVVYNHYDQSIIYPSFDPSYLEKTVVQLWSNQWPRLRRNFTFCTGALSIKVIDGSEFDLQIVPQRNLNSIEKQSNNALIVNPDAEVKSAWIEYLLNSPKDRIRKFLWLYGSDVKGTRSNYRYLVILYGQSQSNSTDFTRINKLLINAFDSDEAQLLKKEIYNENNVFNFDEKDLLGYLTSNEFVNHDTNYINERLIAALKSSKINIHDFISLYLNAPQNKIDREIWKDINLTTEDMINILSYEPQLVSIFSGKIAQISLKKETWQLPLDKQEKLLSLLRNLNDIDWKRVVEVMIDSQSQILSSLLKTHEYAITYQVLWFINRGMSVSNDVLSIIYQSKEIVKDFIRKEYATLNSEFVCAIFSTYDQRDLSLIALDGPKWITLYRKINNDSIRIYAASILLSFAFNRRIQKPAILVSECFSDVYYFAKNSRLSYDNWIIIPIDLKEEEEDKDTLTIFMEFLNIFPPKKKEVPNWDYCEQLIRTLVNKFMKYKWANQYFVDSLKTLETTQSAISYCVGFKKGRRYLRSMVHSLHIKKIRIAEHQKVLFDIVRKEL
jgi:hypothetical protein